MVSMARPEQAHLYRKYAFGKIGAVKGCWLAEGESVTDPDFRYVERWRGTIGKQMVCDAPESSWGFLTRREALASARRFQDKCVRLLSELEALA